MTTHHTVLVVDDDVKILSAIESFLEREHCKMIGASTITDALRELEHHRIHLLITDIRLKFESGVTLFMHVKAHYPRLPIIVMTGYESLLSPEEAKTYGADFFFLKPLDLNELRKAIRTCLHSQNPHASTTHMEDL